MYAQVNWYSKSRNRMVSIGINGGGVCYDRVQAGLNKVPEKKRLAVMTAEIEFTEKLEEIFAGDENLC